MNAHDETCGCVGCTVARMTEGERRRGERRRAAGRVELERRLAARRCPHVKVERGTTGAVCAKCRLVIAHYAPACSCGYPEAPREGFPRMHSADWHREHLAQHVAAFPDLDVGSRRNLAEAVEYAERRETAA